MVGRDRSQRAEILTCFEEVRQLCLTRRPGCELAAKKKNSSARRFTSKQIDDNAACRQVLAPVGCRSLSRSASLAATA